MRNRVRETAEPEATSHRDELVTPDQAALPEEGPGRRRGQRRVRARATSKQARAAAAATFSDATEPPRGMLTTSSQRWRARRERPAPSEIGRAHVELQSLMRNSSAAFCLIKKTKPSSSPPARSSISHFALSQA